MAYDTLSGLPDNVKKALPKGAQEIYMKAFNSACKTYEGEEHKAHAVAWTAVENKYKKNAVGNWVEKESKAKEALSDENRRNLLQTALIAEYEIGKDDPTPSGVYIEDVFETEVVYNINGQSYKASFQMGEGGAIEFGEPEKVVRQTIYKPSVESLQVIYADVIQEAGRRNANLDSGRIKKILQLCQELLSSEDSDEEKIGKAAKEAQSTLDWLKTQPAVKVEEGTAYPVSAFALAMDLNNPDDWKLRLWEGTEATKRQLDKTSAFLSPGGFNGKKVTMPNQYLGEVKRRIRSEYRKLNITDDDIPKWVKETVNRTMAYNYIPLTEAKFDKGRATVIIIKPGFNATEDRYYPAEMLKRDYGIFEGQKMYADHPTEAEDEARPERSIKDWVATLTNVECDESGVVTGVADIVEEWLMKKLSSLRDKSMLSEMGISINAIGSASKGKIDGKDTLIIEELTGARSVDFVTEPGAGGIVTFYESVRYHDVDLVELAAFKERRPDLVKIIETEAREEIQAEVKKLMEDKERIVELETENTGLKTENETLKTNAQEAEKAKAKADAQALIKEAVEKAELPEAAKTKILKSFEAAESDEGIKEAIQVETDYIAELAESGKVKNLGRTAPEGDVEKDTKALRESFKESHPDWTEAQIEIAVQG